MRKHLPIWLDLRQVRPGQSLSGHVRCDKLARWPEADAQGSLHLRLDFRQADSGRLAIAGHITGQCQLTCQRCLEPMAVEIETQFGFEVVETESQAAAIADDIDVLVIDNQRLEIHEVLCDEAQLALPMMPRHAEGTCRAPAPTE